MDFERYVSPAMEEYFGNGTLRAVRSAFDQIRRDAAAKKFQLTCLGLWAAEDFVGGVKQAAADRISNVSEARSPSRSSTTGPATAISSRT